jgi:hypothetical protein
MLERRKERELKRESPRLRYSLPHMRMIIADDMCIVKQQMEGKWYRGIIKQVNIVNDNLKMYKIFYIDYGYTENYVLASRVRDITENYRVLPSQVTRCSLYDLIPRNKQWTVASTNDFVKLTSET